MQRQLSDLTVGFDDLAAEKEQLLQEREQLLAQLDDADKAGLEAETLLQASTAKIETLEKARNAAVQASYCMADFQGVCGSHFDPLTTAHSKASFA